MTIPIRPDVYAYDRALAVLFFHALSGETVSTMAGRGQAAGKPWACVFCKLLDIVVERGHCAKSITVDGTTNGLAAARAGIALLVGCFVPASLLCWAGWALLFALIRAM